MAFLSWLQNLSAVAWVRESESLLGYTLYLAGHTIGMVLLVGPNLIIAARVLGLAPDLPLRPLAKFRPVMRVGLAITVITGLVLFATAPVGYVHNVVFIVKIAAIVVALTCLMATLRALFPAGHGSDEPVVTSRAKALTVATLVFWTVAVVAGRLTAYSGVVVIASLGAFAIVVAGIAVAIALRHVLWTRRREAPVHNLPFDVRPTPANGGK